MPNGRPGGFIIEKTELKNLLGVFPSATVVATKVDIYKAPAARRIGGGSINRRMPERPHRGRGAGPYGLHRPPQQ